MEFWARLEESIDRAGVQIDAGTHVLVGEHLAGFERAVVQHLQVGLKYRIVRWLGIGNGAARL